jgi:hypothetical protein
MPNVDFRMTVGWRSHPKTQKLYVRLGAEGPLGWVSLLEFVTGSKPDGRLTNMDSADVAIAAHYPGDAAQFVDVLKELRLLESQDGVLCVHDWTDHNPYAASHLKRSEQARAAVRKRWDRVRRTPPRTRGGDTAASSAAYPPEFDKACSLYPSREGNSKPAALKAWRARIKDGIDPVQIVAGVERYAAYVRAGGASGKYVKQLQTFFGPNKYWELAWAVNGPDGQKPPTDMPTANEYWAGITRS